MALLDILDCTIDDLIEPVADRPQPSPGPLHRPVRPGR
ncbi:helix-turn-helix transcriptional regulator [Saccharothrix deserti]|nr:helix-turn-helix transcriptional regulator [Saccharothrix deserti]